MSGRGRAVSLTHCRPNVNECRLRPVSLSHALKQKSIAYFAAHPALLPPDSLYVSLCLHHLLCSSPAHPVCIAISMHNAQKMAKWKTLFCCRWHFAFSIARKKEMCLISIQSNFDNAAANTHTHTEKLLPFVFVQLH